MGKTLGNTDLNEICLKPNETGRYISEIPQLLDWEPEVELIAAYECLAEKMKPSENPSLVLLEDYSETIWRFDALNQEPPIIKAKSLTVGRLDVYPIYAWRLLDGEVVLRDGFMTQDPAGKLMPYNEPSEMKVYHRGIGSVFGDEDGKVSCNPPLLLTEGTICEVQIRIVRARLAPREQVPERIRLTGMNEAYAEFYFDYIANNQ